MMKRMSFRRQKRWWNAYILFYTNKDTIDASVVSKMSSMTCKCFVLYEKIGGVYLLSFDNCVQLTVAERRLRVPPRIECNVLKENIEYMHMRAHFSIEYFQFIKKLIGGNTYILNGIVESPVCHFSVCFQFSNLV